MIHGFLDTEVFRRESLAFDSPHFERLVALVSEGSLAIYVTDFIVGEIRRAIGEAFDEANLRLKDADLRRVLSAIGFSSPLLNSKRHSPQVEQLVETRFKAFEELLSRLRAQVITTDDVRAAELRRRYFELVPPFGARKEKRHEFPDAISILALESWATEHSLEIYVVSADKALSEAAALTPSLKPLERIASLIEITIEHREGERKAEAAQKATEALRDSLQEEIYHKFLEASFFVDELEGEVIEVDVGSVDMQSFFVSDIKGFVAAIEIEAFVLYWANIVYADPEQTAYDSETGHYFVFDHIEAKVDRDTTITARAILNLDVNYPEMSTIEEVALLQDEVTIPAFEPDQF